MSLVFDALRQHGTQPTQEPTGVGSVVTPGQRRLVWAAVIGLACLAIVWMIAWLIVEGSASAVERITATTPLIETSVPKSAEISTVSEPEPEPVPEPVSGSRLPGEVLARLAETPPTSARVVAPEPSPAPAPAEATVASSASTRQRPADVPEVTLPEHEEAPAAGDISPVNPAELFMAFNAALAAGQLQQADEVIERTRLALGDTHLIVARMQGYYCMQADCPEQARQAYSTILSRLPRDREAGYNLAVLDWQAGRQAEALRRVRELLSQHPGDEALRALQRKMGAH